jgi:hypothetical protein
MAKRPDIDLIIRTISKLNEQRTKLIFNLAHGKPMVRGLSHEVYRRCGKQNCKCSEGKLHGPYPALSINTHGQKRVVMIRRFDAPIVLKEAKRYHYFQKALAKIRTTNREIDMLLSLLKEKTIRDYR